jgi:hypothetical protein
MTITDIQQGQALPELAIPITASAIVPSRPMTSKTYITTRLLRRARACRTSS